MQKHAICLVQGRKFHKIHFKNGCFQRGLALETRTFDVSNFANSCTLYIFPFLLPFSIFSLTFLYFFIVENFHLLDYAYSKILKYFLLLLMGRTYFRSSLSAIASSVGCKAFHFCVLIF